MPKTRTLQTNFSAGELDPDLGMRQDTEQYQNGAKSLRNRRCLIGGGTVRRPGTWKQPDLDAPSRLVKWVVNRTTQYVVAFSDGEAHFFARNITTGFLTASGSLTSQAWTGDIWREMSIKQAANTMFLAHADMPPQVITRTGAATWTCDDLAFAVGPASRPEQPYLKFADPTRTLTPSDVTGSITLTISGAEAYFTADHDDTYIRYLKRACLITAVDPGGLSVTATVIETLPETYSLTVTASTGFLVGEVVEGSVTGAKGIVTSIPDGTHVVVVLLDTRFGVEAATSTSGAELQRAAPNREKLQTIITFTTADTLVGSNATTAISNVATTTNAGVTDWDEQMFSPVYGYPSCIELHRSRLLFGGHATAPDFLIASAIGNLYDFNVDDGSDADAVLDSIGDSQASRIVSLHSAEQLIVCTDVGPYYVPESKEQPFRPTSIAFYPFGSPWPLSETVQPQSFDDGVLMVAGSLSIIARPQGGNQQAWRASEVSILSPHLFSSPDGLTVVSNFAARPERYAVHRNDDGTLAILQLVEDQKIRNCTPWATDRETDTFDSVVAIEGDLYVHCTREIDGETVYTLELFDQDITLDYAVEEAVLADIGNAFGEDEANVVTESGYHLGTWPLSLDETPDGPYIAGLFYDSEIELFPPVIEGPDGTRAGDLMRIVEMYVHVRTSARFAANGHELQAYQVTDDTNEPPPEKDGPQRFQFLGWRREPTIPINQPDPLPLKVLAIKQLVAY